MLPSKRYSFLRQFIFSLLPTPHIPVFQVKSFAVMKLSKSGEAQSRDSFDYALRLCTKLCTKLPAKHPDMRLSNKVINEIDNFSKDIDQEMFVRKMVWVDMESGLEGEGCVQINRHALNMPQPVKTGPIR
jgi:hypothetical protein